MVHIHAVVRGGYRDGKGAWLTNECRKAGWGFAALRQHGHAARYAAKAARYAAKGAEAAYPAWLSLNGTRPWHWSRGYTAGVPMRDWVRQNAPAKDAGPWLVRHWYEVPADLLDAEGFEARRRARVEAEAEEHARLVADRVAELDGVLRVIDQLDGEHADADNPAELARKRGALKGDAFAGYRAAERARSVTTLRDAFSKASP